MPAPKDEQAKLKTFKKAFRSKAILLVDDDPSWTKALRMLLETLGASVNTASDGTQAVDFLRSVSYDMILLDVQMPGIDGWDLYAILKQACPGKELPIYFLTGLPFSLQTKFITRVPISPNYVLQKSLSPWEILSRLAEHFHHAAHPDKKK
jgi:CheY-like chemotaxis protein